MIESSSRGESLLTRDFIMMSLATLTAFGGMSLLIPVMPVYVLGLGGSTSDIGLVISLFAAVSILFRPFTGRASDMYGSRNTVIVGAVITLVASSLYIWPVGIPVLLLIRVLHGIGISILSTGAFAYMAEIAPADRRGEAIGLFGMTLSLSFAVGPLLGSIIHSNFGFVALFSVLTAGALISGVLSYFVRPSAKDDSTALASFSFGALINRDALLPGVLLFCMASSFAPIATLLPLFSQERELADPGVFFFVQATSIFISRGFAGRLSDNYGRIAVIMPSLLIVAAGVTVLGLSSSAWMFLLAAAIHGTGVGALQPTAIAMAIDRTDRKSVGSAMATVNIFLDFGFAVGAYMVGTLAAYTSISNLYLGEGVVVITGMVLFTVWMKREKRPKPEPIPAASV
ncbi:MAG: MFS transporter [Dehalococcoidia bacterium]|nr:MFS transporter [Dehalococcoidia bacterium]